MLVKLENELPNTTIKYTYVFEISTVSFPPLGPLVSCTADGNTVCGGGGGLDVLQHCPPTFQVHRTPTGATT